MKRFDLPTCGDAQKACLNKNATYCVDEGKDCNESHRDAAAAGAGARNLLNLNLPRETRGRIMSEGTGGDSVAGASSAAVSGTFGMFAGATSSAMTVQSFSALE